MKMTAFAYHRADSVEDALRLHAAAGEGARYVAGGQSLLAALSFRLDEPSALIDISRIGALRGIALAGGVLRIGALTRHAEVLSSRVIARHLPLITEAMAHVAHPAIRNRGTFGGSVALADPAAEMPACCLALGATMLAVGPGGARRIAVDDFFLGLYQTALAPGEILTAVEIPLPATGTRFGFGELARRHGDYAMAGIALAVGPGNASARIALFGVSDRPLRSPAAEAALIAGGDAAAVATEGLEVFGDLNAAEATKRHYASVLLRRALADLQPSEAAA
jgi:aerobic carbon-monoxide dehydrogenase medium subunit